MKLNKVIGLVVALFLLVNVSACSTSPILKTRSGFDNVETLSTKDPQTFTHGIKNKMSMSIVWDETMIAKYKDPHMNTAMLSIEGTLKASNKTSININIDGNKHTLPIINTDKNTTIGSDFIYMANRTVTTQSDELVLYFLISDKLVLDISKSEKTVFMVNLANNTRIEDSPSWMNKHTFNRFIGEKQQNKTAYPNIKR